MPMVRSALALMFGLLMAGTRGSAAAPEIFWVSTPVEAGMAVVVIGHGLDATQSVAVRAQVKGEKWLDAEVLEKSSTSLKFLVPSSLPGRPGMFRVGTGPEFKVWSLNSPNVYWVQGDGGDYGTPGGWVRIFGTSLAPPGAKVRIVSADHSMVTNMLIGEATQWHIAIQIPSTQFAMKYEVQRSFTGEHWESVVAFTVGKRSSPSTSVISVKSRGAMGDGITDDTASIESVLHQLEIQGGGAAYFQPGMYKMTRPIRLGAGVRLVGESREEVALFWPDLAKPPPTLIQGSEGFSIENLTLYASNYGHFVGNSKSPAGRADVRISKVRIFGNPYRGRIDADEVARRFKEQQRISTGGGDLLRLSGDQITIEDSEFYAGGRTLALSLAQNVLIRNNRFVNGRWGWYSVSGSNKVIFEFNEVRGGDLMSSGGGINTLDGSNSARNVLFSNNRFESLFGADREAITSDAPGGFFYGNALGSAHATVTLGRQVEGAASRGWAGAGLFVLGGRGQGQYGVVRELLDGQVVLESPLKVNLDGSSVVTIVPLMENFIFLTNTFVDTGVAIQFYGTAVKHLVVGNTSIRTAGFSASGRWYRHFQPTWYCQFIDNVISEPLYYRGGPNNSVVAGAGEIVASAFPREPNRSPLSMGMVFRGNEVGSLGRIYLDGGRNPEHPGLVDALVERVSSKTRVEVTEGAKRVLVREDDRQNRPQGR